MTAAPTRAGRTAPAPATAGPLWIIDDHQLVASALATSLRAAGHDARLPAFGLLPELAAVLGHPGSATVGLVVLDLELGRDHTGHRIDGLTLIPPARQRLAHTGADR